MCLTVLRLGCWLAFDPAPYHACIEMYECHNAYHNPQQNYLELRVLTGAAYSCIFYMRAVM